MLIFNDSSYICNLGKSKNKMESIVHYLSTWNVVSVSETKTTSKICERTASSINCLCGMISVTNAVYGANPYNPCSRDVRHCQRTVTSAVRNRCNNRQRCSLPSSNSLFGDPCQGTVKYLVVHYNCIGGYYIV